MRECAKLANEAVAAGMCCVIGLQSTGEANTNQTRDEEGDCLDDFVSAPKKILQMFLTKHFPTDDCGLLPQTCCNIRQAAATQLAFCFLSPVAMSSVLIGSYLKQMQRAACLQHFGICFYELGQCFAQRVL